MHSDENKSGRFSGMSGSTRRLVLVLAVATAPSAVVSFVPSCPPAASAVSWGRRGAAFSSSTAPQQQAQPPSSVALLASSTSSNDGGGSTDAVSDEAQRLRDKAMQLRMEIAQMEGKSIDDVVTEAQAVREAADQRKAEAEEKRRRQNLSSSSPSLRRGSGNTILPVPDGAEGQILQAAAAIERAFQDGITRQTVRFALIRDDEDMSDMDESNAWPGGAKQMYREAGRPLTEALLREVRAVSSSPEKEGGDENDSDDRATLHLPPEVSSQDIWDFDGSGLVTAKSASGPRGDVQALVFPNTDVKYTRDIRSIDDSIGNDRLFLLVNPFWRDVESWGFNILAPNGKKLAQEAIFDRGFGNVTYACNRFSVRGEKCVALKAYPYDWQLYAYLEDAGWYNREYAVRLGSSKEEPTSAQFTELLNEREEFKLSKNMRQMQRMLGKDE